MGRWKTVLERRRHSPAAFCTVVAQAIPAKRAKRTTSPIKDDCISPKFDRREIFPQRFFWLEESKNSKQLEAKKL
jgi:hypothetical protein